MDKIYLTGMEFYGYHGVFPEETRLGQRFIVDVELSLPLKAAGKNDDLETTVNYAEVYALVKKIVEGAPLKLIEAVAERIAENILSRFPVVRQCKIKVIKPSPPIPGHFRHVAVEIVRGREHESHSLS